MRQTTRFIEEVVGSIVAIGMMIGKKVNIGLDLNGIKITQTEAGQWVYTVK
jgi:hypothetical protein